jgi:hypothetical protein
MFCIVQQDIGYLPDVSQPKQFCILASILNPEHVARSGSGTSQESDPEVTVLAHPQHWIIDSGFLVQIKMTAIFLLNFVCPNKSFSTLENIISFYIINIYENEDRGTNCFCSDSKAAFKQIKQHWGR